MQEKSKRIWKDLREDPTNVVVCVAGVDLSK